MAMVHLYHPMSCVCSVVSTEEATGDISLCVALLFSACMSSVCYTVSCMLFKKKQ